MSYCVPPPYGSLVTGHQMPVREQLRPVAVELLELLLEGGEPEEPVLLALALKDDLVDRAAVAVLELDGKSAGQHDADMACPAPLAADLGLYVRAPAPTRLVHDARHFIGFPCH